MPLLLLPQSAVGGAAPGHVPDRIGQAVRRRLSAIRRGRFHQIPLVVAAPAAPAYPPEIIAGRRPVLWTSRRGRFQPVPAQFGFPREVTIGRRPVPSTLRRGRFSQIPLSVAAPAPPAYPPEVVVGRRPTPFALRRGRFFAVPPTQVVETPPPYPLDYVAGRRAVPFAIRRGRFHQVPLVGATPAVSAFIPEIFGARRPFGLPCRRGRFGQIQPTAPLVPGWVRHRVNPPRPRCGHFTGPPRVVPYPVPRCAQTRRPAWPKTRRGCFYRVPLVGAIITAPAFPLNPVIGRRPVPFSIRRARFYFIPLVGAAAIVSPDIRHPAAIVEPNRGGAQLVAAAAGASPDYDQAGAQIVAGTAGARIRPNLNQGSVEP